MTPHQFEYMVLDVGVATFFVGPRLNGDLLTARLNELGAQGWELVGMTSLDAGAGQTRDIVLVLKREI